MYKEKIDNYIDSRQDEILNDLMTLVRIDSRRGVSSPGKPFGDGPAAVLDAAGEMMRTYGLDVRNYDNYVVTGDFGPGEKELDILAHLDVVPVTEDWTVTQPFSPLVRDGKIYGRGTADDKGPAIAALYAIRAVRELGIPLKKSVRLILGSDEECGSSDLKHYYGIEAEAPCTFTPDADFPLINIEKGRLAKEFSKTVPAAAPGEVDIVCLQAGDKVNVVPGKAQAVVRGLDIQTVRDAGAAAEKETGTVITVSEEPDGIHILVKGTATHASIPETGVNAGTALLYLLASLDMGNSPAHQTAVSLLKLFPHGDTCGKAMGIFMKDDETGELTSSLGIVRLENGIWSGAFDMRLPLCATDENLTEVVRAHFREAGFELEEGRMTQAHYVPEDSPFVQTLLDSYELYFNKKGKAISTGGGTYVHELKRGVAFGCMTEDVDNHMHGDDEFMVIERLLTSAKIFADVIVKVCG